MSLGYMSRVCVRMVQAAVRAEQPASSKQAPKPSAPAAAAHHQPYTRRFSGGLKDVSAKTAVAAEEKTKLVRMRRAEKDDNVMHLVCWGPN